MHRHSSRNLSHTTLKPNMTSAPRQIHPSSETESLDSAKYSVARSKKKQVIPTKKAPSQAKPDDKIAASKIDPLRRFCCIRWVILVSFLLPIVLMTVTLLILSLTTQKMQTISMIHLLSQASGGKVNEQVQRVTGTAPILVSYLRDDFPLQEITDSELPRLQLFKEKFLKPVETAFIAAPEAPINNIQILLKHNPPMIHHEPGFGVAMQNSSKTGTIAYNMANARFLGYRFPMGSSYNITENDLFFNKSYPSFDALLWWKYASRYYTPENRDTADIMWQDPVQATLDFSLTLLSCSAPFRNKTTGEFIGGVNIQFGLIGLSTYLQERVTPSQHGVAYIVDPKGILIATNKKDAPPVALFPTYAERLKAVQSENVFIRESALYMEQEQGGFSIPSVKQQSIELDVSGFGLSMLNYTKVIDDFGLHWTIVVIIPLSDFDSSLKTTQLVIGLSAGGLLLLGIFTAVTVSLCITFPLNRLTKEMQKVEHMDLNNIKHRKSMFWEVFRIQRSFYIMKDRLILYKSFLPDNIFGDGVDGEDDENAEIASTSSASQSSKHGSSRVSSEFHRLGFLEIGLVSRKATMLTVRITNHVELEQSPEEFVSQYASLLEIVKNIALRTNGKIDRFTEDKICVSYNAHSACKHHTKSALQTAMYIRDGAQKLNFQFKNSGACCMLVNMGICTGHLKAGTLGIDSIRANQVVGAVPVLSDRLSRIGGDFESDILLCQETKNKLRDGCVLKPVGLFQVKGLRDPIIPWAFLELSISTTNKEWMYAHRDEQATLRYNDLEKGVQKLAANPASAQLFFKNYSQKYPEDATGRQWLKYALRLEVHNRSLEEDMSTLQKEALSAGRLFFNCLEAQGDENVEESSS